LLKLLGWVLRLFLFSRKYVLAPFNNCENSAEISIFNLSRRIYSSPHPSGQTNTYQIILSRAQKKKTRSDCKLLAFGSLVRFEPGCVPDSHQYALAIFMRRARRIQALMIAQKTGHLISQSSWASAAPPSYHTHTPNHQSH